MAMKISSPAFEEKKMMPDRYTCDGEDVNPPLTISGVPPEAASLALIVDDPDSVTPTGGWVHWLVWNIDPQACEIGENNVPQGAIQGRNNFGLVRWGGPCPPEGAFHNYRFQVYALKEKINLPEGTDKLTLQKEIEDKVLEKAQLVGMYGHPVSPGIE